MSGLFIHRFTTFISYQKANHITTVFPHTSTSTTVVNPPPCSPCPPRLWEGGGRGVCCGDECAARVCPRHRVECRRGGTHRVCVLGRDHTRGKPQIKIFFSLSSSLSMIIFVWKGMYDKRRKGNVKKIKRKRKGKVFNILIQKNKTIDETNYRNGKKDENK